MTPPIVRWAFRLSQWQDISVDQIRRAFARIQPEEVERLMRFMFLDDLKASLVGRLMIRNFVCTATGRGNSLVHIARDERGKPFLAKLAEDPPISFNVSHQGDFSVLVGCQSPECRVGVDVMRMEYSGGKSVAEFFRLMDRNFTHDEWRYIKGGHDRQDLIGRFMRLWCLKESYVKTLGVGITVDLRQIDFRVESPLVTGRINRETKVRLLGREAGNWHFEETLLDAEHCVAVALECPSPPRAAEGEENGFRMIGDIDWLLQNIEPLRDEGEVTEELCRQVLAKDDKRRSS